MLKRLLLIALLVSSASCRRVQVPVDRMLLAIRGQWTTTETNSGTARFAPATVLSFRSSGEFVEFQCHIIEQPNQVLYISRSHPRITILGQWRRGGWREVRTTRLRVSRVRSPIEGTEPLCKEEPLRLRAAGDSLKSQHGDLFAPVGRLVAPDFESYVRGARNAGASCTPADS